MTIKNYEKTEGVSTASVLRDLREEAELTQKELADKMETAQESISRAEKRGCSLHFLQRAAKACGKTISINTSKKR